MKNNRITWAPFDTSLKWNIKTFNEKFMSPIVFDTLLKAKYVDLSENKVSEKTMFKYDKWRFKCLRIIKMNLTFNSPFYYI